jgi:hypothetical protein
MLISSGAGWFAAPALSAGAPAAATTSAPTPQSGSISWSTLTPQQRSALDPLKKDWAELDGTSQEKWLALANRFPSMSAPERARVQARMTEWARMPAAERGRARLRYQRAKDISPQERQAQWQAYQNLPEDQRRKLAEEATKRRAASPAANGVNGANGRVNAPSATEPTAKSNIVVAPKRNDASLKSIAPTLVQAKPGVTTNLVSKRPTPAPHLQPGLPKVAATPGLVDSTTLLPRQGPQGIKPPTPESGASTPPTHPKKS